MGANTKIEWTDHTFNQWRGCTKVSPGCANCYAETMSWRNPQVLGEWGPNGKRIVAVESYWRQPVKWNKQGVCTSCNGPGGVGHHAVAADVSKCCSAPVRTARVFCESLADVFEDWSGAITTHDGGRLMINPDGEWMTIDRDAVRTPSGSRFATLDDVRARLFSLIDATPNLDWLLLTKRPENILRMWNEVDDRPAGVLQRHRPNAWLGVSVEDQQRADERIPELLKCRDLCQVLFLSCEPLLGPVDLGAAVGRVHGANYHDAAGPCTCDRDKRIDWVIVGGESGPKARPMHPDWARSIRDQCTAAGVPFLFKQWGEWLPFSERTGIEPPKGFQSYVDDGCNPVNSVYRVGKTAAGRTLDGREWDEFPHVNAFA